MLTEQAGGAGTRLVYDGEIGADLWLLGNVGRKNGWQLAEHAGERTPDGLQRLLPPPTETRTWCAMTCAPTWSSTWAMVVRCWWWTGVGALEEVMGPNCVYAWPGCPGWAR